MKLQKDLREFIELLNSARVDYLIVGGHAVAHHGFPRFTGDIDFFIEGSIENRVRLASVLAPFGFPSLSREITTETNPEMIFQLGRPPNRIDLLTSIDGVRFSDAWADKEISILDGLPVFIIGKKLLIQNKQASGRPKDMEDIRQLLRNQP